MRAFSIFLRIIAPIFLLVGALHLTFGLGADAMLGAHVDAGTMMDPGLDSQNRFYGVAFTLYGVLLLLCASDISKYATVLRCLLWVFFAAGLARLVSAAILGIPSTMIIALGFSELMIPPLVIWWLSKTEGSSLIAQDTTH